MILPVSTVIPTRNRSAPLQRTLNSLKSQGTLPAELIVVDASDNDTTREMLTSFASLWEGQVEVLYLRADSPGAASQRNQGVATATQPVIAFFDEDILFQPHCLDLLWQVLQSSADIGGVNATITNQQYHPPGRASRCVYRLLAGNKPDYAGQILGPAVNLLPADSDAYPEQVPVEWLNTTCTLYRREALPDPPFPSHFTGYSLMEDLTLSATVARQWKLFNARTARIFHDSQPGSHKSDPVALAEMELLNRYYVTTQVLGRRGFRMLMKLALWESFQLLSLVRSTPSPGLLARTLWGKIRAIPRCYQMREQSLSNP